MVRIVADNTVLSNFALIVREDVLASLFGDAMAATDAVMAELSAGEAKGIVPRRDWSWPNSLLSDMIEKGYYAPYHEIDALL